MIKIRDIVVHLECTQERQTAVLLGDNTQSLIHSCENATKIPLISYRMLTEFIRTLHVHAKDSGIWLPLENKNKSNLGRYVEIGYDADNKS